MNGSKAMRLATFLVSSALQIAAVAAAAAQSPPAKEEIPLSARRNFVACPVMRDTSNVGCWLADYQGETYFLGIPIDATGWSPPLQGHRILVEGVVAEGPRICGGIPLRSPAPGPRGANSGTVNGASLPVPPIVSSLRELDPSCTVMLPAEEKYNNIVPKRGPGPNPQGPKETLDELLTGVLARSLKPPGPPPHAAKEFTLTYDFDSELAALTIAEALQAAHYAKSINAKAVEVTGYRATTLLSTGEALKEMPQIGRLRAEEAASTLRRLGLPPQTALSVSWKDEAEPGNGIDDFTRRKTVIRVVPADDPAAGTTAAAQ
jgi:hypothetical protein